MNAPRSYLFVPGDRPERFEKALGSAADAVRPASETMGVAARAAIPASHVDFLQALPVLLTTGYSAAAAAASKEGRRVLVKPYRIEALAAELRNAPGITAVDVAGPGFLNLTFHPSFWHAVVHAIFAQGAAFGRSDLGGDAGRESCMLVHVEPAAERRQAHQPEREQVPAVEGEVEEAGQVHQEGIRQVLGLVDHDVLVRAVAANIEADRAWCVAAKPPQLRRAEQAESVQAKLFPTGMAIVNVSLLAESGNAARVAALLASDPTIAEYLDGRHPSVHLLVVDDDARIRELLRRYLTQEGFEVSLAEDGAAMTRSLKPPWPGGGRERRSHGPRGP